MLILITSSTLKPCLCSSEDRASGFYPAGRRFDSCQRRLIDHLKQVVYFFVKSGFNSIVMKVRKQLKGNQLKDLEPREQNINLITFLRAISIILVILSHNPFFDFKIGVIGVDIFFLISGFLITTQLQKLTEAGGLRPLLRQFYFRRARRILPSLILSLSLTLVLFNFTTTSSFYKSVKDSALPALLFYANFYQINNLTQYFNFSFLNPLASFWSLSIEEQIYICLPLILYTFWKLKLNKFFLFLILATPSLVYLLTYTGPDKYFQPLSRILPFSLGLLLSYLLKEKRFANLKFIAINKFSYLLILSTYLYFIKGIDMVNYPDYRVLPVILLTTYFIYSNLIATSHENELNRIINFIGLRSYNIYLLYLPIGILMENKIDARFKSFTLSLIFTVILASFLHRFDILHRKHIKNFKALVPPLTFNLLLFLVIYNLPHFGPGPSIKVGSIRTTAQLNSSIEYALEKGFTRENLDVYQAQRETANIFKTYGLNLAPNKTCLALQLCSSATKKPSKTLFLIADSAAGPFTPFYLELARKHGAELYWLNMTGCDATGIPLDDWNITDDRTTKRCLEFYKTLEPTLKELKSYGDLSIIFQQASSPLRTFNRGSVPLDLKRDYYIKSLNLLKKYTSHLTLVSEVAFKKVDPVECLSKKENTRLCSFSPTDQFNIQINLQNKELAQAFNLPYIDLRDFTCIANKCPVVINKTLVYRDMLHLSTPYVESIKELLTPLYKIA